MIFFFSRDETTSAQCSSKSEKYHRALGIFIFGEIFEHILKFCKYILEMAYICAFSSDWCEPNNIVRKIQ